MVSQESQLHAVKEGPTNGFLNRVIVDRTINVKVIAVSHDEQNATQPDSNREG